jgi:tripartite-type tricarboxylate transporter receptor subunit TctC
MGRITRRGALAGMGGLALTPATGRAQSPGYPTRPIKILVPFPPGGPTDLVARVIAEAMSSDLKQPVVIDNRPGANGNVAVEAVSRSEPDGYTLVYNTSAVAISPALYPKLGYDIEKDLAPIALTATVPLVLIVHPGIPATNVKEFIDYARSKPGELSYASTGIGSVTHLGAALFQSANGIKAVHVPFRGSAPALTALSGSHVHFMTDTVNSSYPLINGGQIRGLAVLGSKRVPVVPGLPTLEESGLRDFEIGAWQGLMAPKGTPSAIVDRLNASVLKALEDASVKEKLAIQGATILGSTPEQYRDYILAEVKRWGPVVRDSGAKAE